MSRNINPFSVGANTGVKKGEIQRSFCSVHKTIKLLLGKTSS